MTEKSLDHCTVVVTEANLPLRCPPVGVPTYNAHPLQWFDIVKCGEVKCPYCSTIYVYEGEKPVTDEMYEGDNHVMPGT